MKNTRSDVDVLFRFHNLNKLQAITLEREVCDATSAASYNKDDYVGSVALTETSIQDINDFYVRQRIEIGDCDILVSVVPRHDAQTFDVPAVVNVMLKYIDCKLRYAVRFT